MSSYWIVLLLSLLALFTTPLSEAWESHYLLTYGALKNMPGVVSKPLVPAEALATFVEKEKTGLVKLLQDNEKWSLQHVPNYPPLPAKLAFTGVVRSGQSLQQQLLESIRVNPELHYPLFLQSLSGNLPSVNSLPAREVMLASLAADPTIRIVNPPLQKVSPGQMLTPLAILSTASDEPDYGFDVDVWQNNATWFGKIYGFGQQPFGNPNVEYSSQAPFHMGFYHESMLLYKAASFLQRCYPEYRIHLYLALSQYAFKTGHPYWGYRFLGWALHYVQDLTQPYHSTVAPGMNTATLIGINVLDLMGLHTFKQNTIQLLTNRHFALENYEYNLLRVALLHSNNNNPFARALADQQHDTIYPPYDDTYPRGVVAKESHAKAVIVDKAIRSAFPERYTADPGYIFYTTDPEINLLEAAKNNFTPDLVVLNAELIAIMTSIGSHTRKVVEYVLGG